MRSDFLHRALLLLLPVLALVGPATAAAAKPVAYELPAATHALSLAPAPDGSVWFGPFHGSRWEGAKTGTLGRLGADGTVGELDTGGLNEPVVGPEGQVWADGVAKNAAGEVIIRVGRIGSAGQVESSYPVGRGEAGITAIAAGAGAVWFSLFHAYSRDVIKRLATDGSVTQELVAGAHCSIGDIAVAADEAVWFTEGCAERSRSGWGLGHSFVGRITPSGKVVRRPVEGKGYPTSITLADDGTVWFGVSHPYSSVWEAGRISPAGKLAEFPVPDGYLESVAVGPEGRLWFPSSFGGGIYRALDWISSSGKVGKPVCADPTCELEPHEIAADASGGLWYGLWKPHTIGGGGGTQLAEGTEIENEAGFIGHLVP